MATIEYFKNKDILTRVRTTVETAFYGNNVVKISSPAEMYSLAKNSPGTIVTDMPIYKPEEVGLPQGATVLLFNDGEVTGRFAAARRIAGEPGVDINNLAAKVREAVYNTRYRKLYHCQAYAGLHEDFMVKLHLLIPENHENIALSWMLNFQYINDFYYKMYQNSKEINEGDIYIFSDPDWRHPEHPGGLAFFDPENNVAAILGMRYFGEHKKGTLTLVWGSANRNGYASCHGGMKRYNLDNGRSYVVSVFGLSGSGKSTITHAKHDNKYDVTVLHDDAFIINTKDGSSIALEPAYFDKTQDYPMGSEDNRFILTAQNTGATLDENGKVVLVTEDIRNGNGRAIKSKLWSPNRVDKFEEKTDAVFWLMKDPTLPPVVKVKGSALGSAMGATLATKRTTAERLAEGVDPNALVVEPYANPFRTYPLSEDYNKFKALFDDGIDCYILNTGAFMDKDIGPKVTLGIIEAIVEGTVEFKQWANFTDLEIMEIEGYVPDFNDSEYKKQFTARMKDRVEFIKSRETAKGGFDKLPAEALEAIEKVIKEI
ncbi:MAG TPA: phosphoenolpyruvate carboxykinase (ATP) [Halanaerobiaceae bacterium]|mgnify:CR=1 FL=1|jgi:phosphoenolpyruvate carboxykinase (ATP)|nr:phosphoenolpyruvate carboxykinase (ATP) [Halanaerobiaceae bacterium]HOA41423.1 phosphoenolpyruvate carboxykinase (ATP) [Halanaerobiales bacterium]HPZ63718.1 phosphoenolpyruvate carboxykinase (ATP) [Halanaerobiales bacterium]HQD04926.1 phosphoenolpyruvate carboxykinase (ATP) [Halanaerobiales bacterium]